MVVVVYNDAAYGAEVHHFGDRRGPGHGALPRRPTSPRSRAGFGCAGLTVRTVADLDGVTDWLAGPRDRPLLLDAKTHQRRRLVVAGGGVPVTRYRNWSMDWPKNSSAAASSASVSFSSTVSPGSD